jgi:hypothetical protein
MKAWIAVTAAAVIAVAGCADKSLPYKPAQQPPGATISAAYQIVGDRLQVEIDTDGYRLEETKILQPDGALQPQTIEHVVLPSGGSGVSIGIGVGGGSWGGGSGVGGGVGVGVPVGGSAGGKLRTFAYFPLAQVGPAPWQLYVKLAGIAPSVILLGMPPAPPKQ